MTNNNTKGEMMKAKVVRTTLKHAGNKYGIITKGSRMERMYGVELDGVVYARDYFLTKLGATFAADCVNAGLTIPALNHLNADDIASQYKCHPKGAERQAWWEKRVADYVTYGR